MNFSEKLIDLRKKSGLSQEELGDKLNVTRQTISKWELGETIPNMNKLMDISNLFNISLEELTGGENNKKKENKVIEEKPRKWLLVVLIIISLVIVVILADKFITDRNNSKFGLFSLFEKMKEQINDNDFIKDIDNKIDKEGFNNDFVRYSGKTPFVESLLDNVINNNKTNKEHIVTVVFNNQEITDNNEIKNLKVSLTNYYYEVTIDYDDNGYVNKVTIEDLYSNKIEINEDKNQNNNNNKNNNKVDNKNNDSIDFNLNHEEIKENLDDDWFLRESFNSYYELMKNDGSGMSVKLCLDRIISNNKNGEHLITVVYQSNNYNNESEIKNVKNNIANEKKYGIQLGYDEKGFVNLLTIIE